MKCRWTGDNMGGGDFNTTFDTKLDKQGENLNCTNIYSDEFCISKYKTIYPHAVKTYGS